ncbi:carboxypeptidase regulatory-like domain-containing protein [Paraglaciecola arctica]|uniref:carboxypeptidase regulatory-like domain-containing protein n=1 Tax=Paraglaciecola arctica TaxID=1128911 RepID=UPI001C06B98E|nr:carboxypeptidase regulatory-like domain-containing protein [Paraglaciecola arctica]MBU3004321.1 carboxypeptidase regulatory-like domain-containing protein [Paraglaciecola arctica]
MKIIISLKRIFTLVSFLLLTSICVQAQAVQLDGTVFGGSSPLPDVQVSLYVQGEDESSAVVTTDNAGQYLFDVPAGTYDLALSPLVSSGYASTAVTSILVGSVDVTHNVVLIDNASILNGVVRDGEGLPISNILLTINDQISGTKIANVLSDENGTYSVALADGIYEVDVRYSYGKITNQPSPELFTIWPLESNVSVSGDTVKDLDLPFVSLSGQTLDSNGVAVAGVTISADSYWSDPNVDFYQFRKVVTSTVSDESGNYSMVVLEGLDALVLTPPENPNSVITFINGLGLTSNTDRDLVLAEQANLTGIVRDGSGLPISNIQLTFNDQSSGTEIAAVLSDENGTYSVALADGTYEVDVRYAYGKITNQPSPEQFTIWPLESNVTVSGDTVKNLDLPFVSLSGQTVDSNGVAVAGVTISADSYWSDPNVDFYQFRKVVTSTVSDGFGNYSMVVIAGLDTLVLTPPENSMLAISIVNNLGVIADTSRNLVLQPLNYLTGVVRDGSGITISNIQLTFNDQSSGTEIATVLSDVNGEYSVALADGSYEIDVRYAYGKITNQPSPEQFTIWPLESNVTVSGDTVKDLDLPFVTLSGQTVDSNGVAVAGVTISADSYWSDPNVDFYQFRKVVTSTVSDGSGNYSMVAIAGLDSEAILPPENSGFAQTVLNGLNLQQDTSQAIILNFVDSVAPLILNGPMIRDITSSSAVIEWTTDEPTNSVVSIGGQTITDTDFVTNHIIPVTGLTANNTYSVTVESTDEQGNGPASGVASFTTLETPDNQAPVIINGPLVEQVTHNSAVIKFATDEVATGVVKLYQGETLIAQLNTALTTEHEVLFSELNANAAYEVLVAVTDSLVNGPTLSQRVGFVTLALADTTAPIILSGPFISDITNSEATVTWITNEPASSGISYNDGTAYGVLSNDELTTDHKMRLTGLDSATDYNVTVSSQDAKANGPTLSQVETFSTLVILDTTAPKLLGIPLVHEINKNHVGLFVHTDETAAVQIHFGLSADNLAQTAGQAEAGTKTKINLQHLAASTRYYYQVQLSDETGNTALLPEIYSVITAAQNKNKTLSFAVPPIAAYTSDATMVVIWRTHQQSEGQLRCTAANDNVYLVQSKAIDNDSGNRSKGLRHQATLTNLALNTAFECSALAYTAKEDPVGMPVEQTQLTASLFDSVITGEGTVTMDAQVDATAPIFISEPAVVYISNRLAVIEWDTDELVNASVSYWPRGSNEVQIKSSTEFLSSHQIPLNNLSQSTIYEYQVEVTDPSGNVTLSAQKTLTTTANADNTPALYVDVPTTNNIATDSFSIAFVSNELTTAQISYGFSASDLSLQTSIETPRIIHQITLTDLALSSVYFYKVTLSDFAGNITESEVIQGNTTGFIIVEDSDGDGIIDADDAFPLISIGNYVDTDNDGAPNECDSNCLALGMTADADDDNDGIADIDDPFPLNPNTVPSSPVITSIETEDGALLVGFSASGDGGSSIIDYTVSCGANSVTSAQSPIRISKLENDVTYACSVTARNALGNSFASIIVSATPEGIIRSGLNIPLLKAILDAQQAKQ